MLHLPDMEARRAALRASPLFARLDPGQIEAVLAQATARRASRGDALLQRGRPSAGVIIIVAGRVRIAVVSEGGGEVTLGILGPGDVLGEMSVLDGGEVSADAVAIEDCLLLAIDRARFLHLLRGNGDLCVRLMAVLCQRLRRSNANLEDLALQDMSTRLGRLVLRLAQDYGARTEGGLRIQVKLSQKDLGAMIGASREKVNKQLRQWEQDGILAREGGHMIVQRIEALSRLTASGGDAG